MDQSAWTDLLQHLRVAGYRGSDAEFYAKVEALEFATNLRAIQARNCATPGFADCLSRISQLGCKHFQHTNSFVGNLGGWHLVFAGRHAAQAPAKVKSLFVRPAQGVGVELILSFFNGRERCYRISLCDRDRMAGGPHVSSAA